eukprot:PhF_6_TR41627/c0_g1_i1/m.63091
MFNHFQGTIQVRNPSKGVPPKSTVRVVHISDTHNNSYQVPGGDILLHTGDLTDRGTETELDAFRKWFGSLPHSHKIVIGGNHEHYLDVKGRDYVQSVMPPNTHFLDESSVTIWGLKFFGSSWAFTKPTWGKVQAWAAPEETRRVKWEKIPSDTDFLLTHNPPYGVLDTYHDKKSGVVEHWGCKALREKVVGLKVPFHCFGHVHYVTGIEDKRETDGVVFSNAAMKMYGKPSVFDLKVVVMA